MSDRISALEACKRTYGPGCAAKVEKLLASFTNARFGNAESLIRFHDALLFLRAFPHNKRISKLADRLLSRIAAHVEQLRKSGADLDLFDDEQFSGIAGTAVSHTFTYEVAEWLNKRHGPEVMAEWDIEGNSGRMALNLPRFIPLLRDDSEVEADVPYREWLKEAAGASAHEHSWLLRRLAGTSMSELQKTEIYDGLNIALRWELGSSQGTRTLARGPAGPLFVHDAPLIQRRDISLQRELASPPDLPLRHLPQAEGIKILDLVRDAVTVRYRELYGTTRGDPSHVFGCDVGRGIQIYLWGLPPNRRLPLRAYHAGITFKNGVPINYIEGISLCEWMEVGFNTFYAFREGETAWVYSKVLHLLHQLTGVACISVYPYQLGKDNEEAIKSGAFWFYRKLGFRPGRPDLLALTEREERRMRIKPEHRTSASTLRKVAAGHVFYEFGAQRGAWDSFSTRNIGFAVQRRMSQEFDGDHAAMRYATTASVSDLLNVDVAGWDDLQREAFENFALVLSSIPEFSSWTNDEKARVVEVIRAKTAANECDYLRLLQQFPTLRNALLHLGSVRPA